MQILDQSAQLLQKIHGLLFESDGPSDSPESDDCSELATYWKKTCPVEFGLSFQPKTIIFFLSSGTVSENCASKVGPENRSRGQLKNPRKFHRQWCVGDPDIGAERHVSCPRSFVFGAISDRPKFRIPTAKAIATYGLFRGRPALQPENCNVASFSRSFVQPRSVWDECLKHKKIAK